MPSGIVTAVTVSHPVGTIFIGTQTQFHATATMGDGTTQAATNATWSSDAPGIATVSSAGQVSPLKAGEATISADLSVRGSKHIRVYPNFGGTWAGGNVVLDCQAIGAFVGAFCVEDAFKIGQVFLHDSKFRQTNDAVEAEILVGDVETARMSGTISIDGELQLPSAAVLPSIEGIRNHFLRTRQRRQAEHHDERAVCEKLGRGRAEHPPGDHPNRATVTGARASNFCLLTPPEGRLACQPKLTALLEEPTFARCATVGNLRIHS